MASIVNNDGLNLLYAKPNTRFSVVSLTLCRVFSCMFIEITRQSLGDILLNPDFVITAVFNSSKYCGKNIVIHVKCHLAELEMPLTYKNN